MAAKKKQSSIKTSTSKQKDVSIMADSVQLATDEVRISASSVQLQGGSTMDSKLKSLAVIGAVVVAFVVGNLYGKVSLYEQGMVQGTTERSGDAGGAEQQAQAPAEAAAPTVLTDEQWEQVVDFDTAAHVMGNEDADVVLVEFTDYECPFCARYFTDTYGAIIEQYVETDQIAYVTRDLPLSFHANAEPAALAARCAGDQGNYEGMHKSLFENQSEWSTGDAREVFVGYANDLGLNVGAFESCYDNGDFTEAIQADLALASSVGANGTPTFFINGEKLVGAQPTATFQATLDAALGQ